MEIDESSENLSDLLGVFLRDNPGITGIFASNDFPALAIIRSARELNLRVPQDLSIFGFDGIQVGTMVEPSLATIVSDPNLSFSFRAGGSLMPLVAERKNDDLVAPNSPSKIGP